MGVYLYPNNTETSLKNAYIGEYRVPWVNTIAYYPLNSTTTVNDMSGNNRNLTNNNVTFWTNAGVSCAYFNGSNGSLTTTSLTTATMTTNHTISLWFNRISGEWGLSTNVPISWWNGYNMYINTHWSTQVEVMYNGGTQFYSNYPTNAGTWHLVTYTHNSDNQVVLYVDWEQKTSWTKWFGIGNAWRLCLWAIWFYNENPKLFYNWYISNFIIENKARTAQEVTDYYNLTKSNYGL